MKPNSDKLDTPEKRQQTGLSLKGRAVALFSKMIIVTFLLKTIGFLGDRTESVYLLYVALIGAVFLLYINFFLAPRWGSDYTKGKKIIAVDAYSKALNDLRPPILYLRSFDDDAPPDFRAITNEGGRILSPEETIAEVANFIGPMVAIGRPGEELPELGAARLYAEDDEWQNVISEKISIARFIIVKFGVTKGLLWELEQVIKIARPENIIFYFGEGRRRDINRCYKNLCAVLPSNIPEQLFGQKFLFFDEDWSAYGCDHLAKVFLAIYGPVDIPEPLRDFLLSDAKLCENGPEELEYYRKGSIHNP